MVNTDLLIIKLDGRGKGVSMLKDSSTRKRKRSELEEVNKLK